MRLLLSIFLAVGSVSCSSLKDEQGDTLFTSIAPDESHVDFTNKLENSDDFNIIEYLYFYNGAGVAAGDINNDGLADIYFSSNQQDNRLYLNKGDFRFEDITIPAGVAGIGNWKTGVAMADVNGDGWLDIFACGVGSFKKFNGRNQLYVNNGDLTFTDRADEYGLAFQGFSTQAAFFDYDNDGDLDLYLLNHSVHSVRSYGDASLRLQSDPLAGDKLYRNELVPHGRVFYTEVTQTAGVFSSALGYGLGVAVSDLNNDGWQDIYVANDFHENDYLYVNQTDGTFRQVLESAMPHTSRFSMGVDIADINNDGWLDIATVDMLPRREDIIKTTAGEDSYELFSYKLKFGYHRQFTRNTLQLNNGTDSKGRLFFGDIAAVAGVEATDWSWGPLLADLDLDGKSDLFVSSGIVGRPNDLDYINYISQDSVQRFVSDRQLYERMPPGEQECFVFRNINGTDFSDVSADWFDVRPRLSSGAAYSDLDNDGDHDLIINCINEHAFLYRNNAASADRHFLKVKFDGRAPNKFGWGARVECYYGKSKIVQEQSPVRGWLSSVDPVLLFGLGEIGRLDSVTITWPGRMSQTLYGVAANQTITVKQDEAATERGHAAAAGTYLSAVEAIAFTHREDEFSAFASERLIPHMLSTEGPKMSAGDVNGDNLTDVFIGGASGAPGRIFLQQPAGSFRAAHHHDIAADSLAEDTGSLLFDANGDQRMDLLVVGGGQRFPLSDDRLLPRLYLNDGEGRLRRARGHLPDIQVNASCVRHGDVDHDGDSDLFIGGRVVPGRYGINPKSYLLLNDGRGRFSDATTAIFGKDALGMVTDASWVDVNGDSRQDLVVVGEWMPISVFVNDGKGLVDRTVEWGLGQTGGWWNSIACSDFDSDGDSDLVAGNLGLNTRMRASGKQPVEMFVADIDGNGSAEQVLTYYNGGLRHPFVSRDQLVQQVPSLKRKFLKYSDYKQTTMEDIFSGAPAAQILHKQAEMFASIYIENRGAQGLAFRLLPPEVQRFPVFSMEPVDVNGDGHLDLLAVGNFHAVRPDFGSYDAGCGLVMLGDGKGGFETWLPRESGFVVRGEGRDVKSFLNSKGEWQHMVARNNDTVLVFKHR